jgi:hypothetical protein
MHVNGKMILIGTILGMRAQGIKENGEGVNSPMIYLIYCRNYCKCHNLPLPNTIVKFKKEKERT